MLYLLQAEFEIDITILICASAVIEKWGEAN